MLQTASIINNWRTKNNQSVANLAAQLSVPNTGFRGRTVYNDTSMRAVLLAFAPLQRLSDPSTSTPVYLHVLEGEVEVTVGKRKVQAEAGHWVDVPPRHEHSIYVKSPSKLLMLLEK
ncbi:MAG: cupin domain-containing protein [Ardenticatenaceae bacterium]